MVLAKVIFDGPVDAVAEDDQEGGEPEVASVSIDNTEPVVTSVSITPETAYAVLWKAPPPRSPSK